MSTHNIGFYEDLTKIILNYHQISSNMHLISSAASLKIYAKNNYSIKSYDETNMKVFALSLLENFNWGLTYFDCFR